MDGRRHLSGQRVVALEGAGTTSCWAGARVRLWGEEDALVARAGGDLAELQGLEDALAAGVAGMAGRGGGDRRPASTWGSTATATASTPWACWPTWTAGASPSPCASPPTTRGRTASSPPPTRRCSRPPGRPTAGSCPSAASTPPGPARPRRWSGPPRAGLGAEAPPRGWRFRPEDPRVAAAVRDAAARGWPVTIHAGFGARPLAGPLGELLDAAPGARVILALAGRRRPRHRACEVAARPG